MKNACLEERISEWPGRMDEGWMDDGGSQNTMDAVKSLFLSKPSNHSSNADYFIQTPSISATSTWTTAPAEPPQAPHLVKSAHTALAVKACLLGGNSNTKCSMTFVNIAVAISALAGGGQKRFRTETRIRWCFRHFSRIFGCLSARGYWNGILGHFGSFPAMEKRPKMKKTLYIARFCRVFGCQSIENTAKTSVLDWRYSKKRVNYRMLDWKHYKNTVKSNVLEGFTAFMAKNV